MDCSKLEKVYKKHYSKLFVTKGKNKKFRDNRMGGYLYTIKNSIGHGITAYRTEEGFKRYLRRTGLKKGSKFSESKDMVSWRMTGTYDETMMKGNQKLLDAWAKKNKMTSYKALSNGEYTRGWYKKTKSGNKLYYLNVNCPRFKYKYFYE